MLTVATTRYQKLPAWLNIVLVCLLAMVLAAVGQTLGMIVPDVFNLMFEHRLPDLHVQLASFLALALVLFAWVKWYEKRSIRSLGFSKGNTIKVLLRGWGLGSLLFSLAIGLSAVFGGVELTAIDFSMGTVVYVLSTIPFWMIQSETEELLMQSWLFPILKKRSHLATALAVSSSLLGLLHLLNANVMVLSILGIVMSGVMMVLYAAKTDNI